MVPLSRTGVLVYNAPGIGITLSPSTLEQLAEIPGVVGVKQGDLSPTAIDQIANRLYGRIRLFCASDLAFLGPVLCGFDGVSSTNSCALPELILATYRVLEAGDAATARDLHRLWYPFRALAREFGQPQTTKAAMNLRGFGGGGPSAAAQSRDRADRGCGGSTAEAGGRSALQRRPRRLKRQRAERTRSTKTTRRTREE
jgi:4-hydroxy-tetrahydrodipicolinate synthase